MTHEENEPVFGSVHFDCRLDCSIGNLLCLEEHFPLVEVLCGDIEAIFEHNPSTASS
jgi:hypothetical protein